ncbi:MAG TPA: lytic transglycosylase domain-containing protein [Desulfonatronum sp.]|nr:lytic transglycosylase domain-containing protein [Desulfonatronum sp.]
MNNKFATIRRLIILGLFFLALFPPLMPKQGRAEDRTAVVPMTIDFSLLNTLVAQSFFAGTKQETVLLHEQDGCRDVVVSSPRFYEEDQKLFLEIRLYVRHGLGVGSVCLLPVTFDGFLVMHKTPAINPADWTLGFSTESSLLLTADRKPARLANLAWSMVEEHVFGHQETIRVDLGPPIMELREFLPLIMPKDQPDLMLAMLASLRPGVVTVEPLGLRLENEISVPWGLFHEDVQEEAAEEQLTDEELERFIAGWEVWDAFLVNIITTLAGKELEAEERLLLLDVLLRLRHAFLEELEAPEPGRDLVRAQFVEAWGVLGPLFRSHLASPGSGSMLGYFAFFSASDALVALDKLGPALGLDISREGLLRLAHLLAEGKETLLDYGPEVLPDLLRTLGLEDHSTLDEAPLPSHALPWFFSLLGRLFAAPARAESFGFGRDDPWIFRRSDLHGYLDRVQTLLREQATITVSESSMVKEHALMFEDLVLATAWQESCFRQFVATGEQVTFLRSYNNTSVGLMQINERVWRGIYDQYKLRWDIAYNARAGTKILELYLTKYAEPKMRREPDRTWDADTVAGLLYAMYNGGPGQRDRFMQRLSDDKLYRNDSLFREKWDWVRQEALDKASICLVGH